MATAGGIGPNQRTSAAAGFSQTQVTDPPARGVQV